MGVIVFHAGTPKTGSTTIQDWLAERLAFLQARGIQCVRIAQSSPEAPITLDPADREGVVSKFVLPRHRKNWPARTESICAALDAQAGHSEVTVVTSESYEVLFNDHRAIPDDTDATDGRATLGPFDELAKSHSVRVAYYVRPQDSWLEAAWLQWGFRHLWSPQGWIRTQQRRISYLQTWQRVHEAAPSLSFEMRPFRSDLLAGGHVVADFASTFLGLDVVREPTLQERWANRSLPLELAILLRQAPPELFWSSIHDNRRISALKDLILSWDLPKTDLATRSRELLRRYAYTTFESDNRRLIDEFGWNTEHFIEPGDADATSAPADLAELDLLWNASASEAERSILFRVLQELLEVSDGARAVIDPADGVSSPRSSPSQRSRDERDPRVRDVAPDVGLEVITRTFGAVVFDYDNDGWPDIYLGRHDAEPFLYRNNGGRFERVQSVRFPAPVDRHCAAAGDLTGDGRADIFCVVGGDSGHGPKRTPNELWLQQPDGTLVNAGDQPGLADPYGRGREVLLFDATGNGRLDVLVGNVSPRSDGEPSPNRLFVNEGNGRFRPAPELGLDVEYSVGGAGRPGWPHGGGNWPMGRLRTIDANGDGWTDVVMSATSPAGAMQSVHLFRNDRGRGFSDATVEAGLSGIAALDVAVADMDGDGQPDLVLVGRLGITILLNDHGRFRLAHSIPVDQAFRVAVADADGDGRPDIYVMRTRDKPGPDVPDLLLLNNGSIDDYATIVLPTVSGTVRDDDVYPIDYDCDGRSEFLVLHGHSLHPAPIQLIKLL